jgi:hypothetical protein
VKNDPPLPRLSDAQLQERIERFGNQLLQADARFQRTGSIDDRTERDQAWIAQRELLKERSRRRQIVQAMEEGRGLA